ncbi:tyrosine/phenylalanine carboxypeptidase domain-containing protein [Ferrimonas lipolytica]|uniref:DUF1704 domain-containing protein n=1 Tax=Ferrimonas lipolytica TaxID=2724191 RepID=A0A6H1UE68_9GAMM|nr:tyrosine/phenylalanine carboxypeptidase domain-containing protein [Ferrimonas lipolytica]QIZ76633.1 DUF1704 domain-containing protein [Ferrimonas lipolytica]
MATTLNARQQPLKLLRLGLPGATFTQEGLAILAEFTSGGMWLSRLKQLAARVLAVDALVRRHSFVDTCQLLQQHGIDEQQAFSITARAYRGGGFTKDYLYLSGFVAMLRACQQRCPNNLLVGKAGIEHIDILNELVEREVFVMPKPLVALQPDTKKQGELAYLVR